MELHILTLGDCATNTYVIIENSSAIIIDPATDNGIIEDFLSKHNATAECVLVTHAHFDHIGGVSALERAGAKVYVSKTDYELLKRHDFNIDLGFYAKKVTGFIADVLLSDGDEFTACNHKFKVVETPGHTPGGVCYVMDGKYIFSGDTLFRLSVGRTDFPFCSNTQLKQSLKKLFSLDGDYTVYPGHGDFTTLDFERKYNPYAN